MNISHSLLILIFLVLPLVAALLLLLYRRFPMHLIYKSKIGLQDVFDGITDPLAVINSDFVVLRVNLAYTTLVNKSFSETIGKKCFELFRRQSTPCRDCRLLRCLSGNKPLTVERTAHPSGSGTISITFTPFVLAGKESCVIEHIRDITLLEKLKYDLETKNRSLAQTMRKLKHAQQNIKDELQLARNLQQGLLPSSAPSTPFLKIDHMYHPITEVGGDIYDFISYPPNSLGIFIGDASGHGLSAAFVGTISKMSLYNHAKTEIPVAELVSRINEDLINNIHTGHYLTCFWGIFNFEKAVFTYCRAGHPMPIKMSSDGTITQLSTPGTFIGILANAPFEEASVVYQPGDRFFIFTDGIYEVESIAGEKEGRMLGYDNFISLLSSCKNTPFNKLLYEIRRKLGEYRYDDDYTLIVIEAVR